MSLPVRSWFENGELAKKRSSASWNPTWLKQILSTHPLNVTIWKNRKKSNKLGLKGKCIGNGRNHPAASGAVLPPCWLRSWKDAWGRPHRWLVQLVGTCHLKRWWLGTEKSHRKIGKGMLQLNSEQMRWVNTSLCQKNEPQLQVHIYLNFENNIAQNQNKSPQGHQIACAAKAFLAAEI